MTLSHSDARQLVATAFANQFGRQGTLTELQCVQAIGWLETNYGASWKPPGNGSFNMGAIQRQGWPGSFFEYTDTHPNADGTSTPYKIGFRKYSDAVAGFGDLIHVVYLAFDRSKRVLPAASSADILRFSTELHKYPAYFEGYGSSDSERIAHHAQAVLNAIKLQCAALNEPFAYTTSHLPVVAPALLIGCKGPAVEAWQRIVGATPDGDFGGATQVATRAWQASHGLPATGIVCQPDLVAAGLAPASEPA